jgi:hypothetical protein
MPEADTFLLYTRRLEQLGLRYMVSGSIAAIYYGEPRMTNNVDIVLALLRGHLNLIHHATGFKADLYLAGREDLHEWGLDHVRTVTYGTDRIRLAPPEYVILRKLQFYREGKSQKHLRDVQRMLVGLGEEWDRDTLLAAIRRYGLTAEWEEVRAFEE